MGVRDWLEKAYRGVVNVVETGISSLKTGFEYVTQKIQQGTSQVYGDITGGFKAVYEDVKSGVSFAGQQVSKGFDLFTNPLLWIFGGLVAVQVIPQIIKR